MLTKWGAAFVTAAAGFGALAVPPPLPPAAPSASSEAGGPQPLPGTVGAAVELRVERDGRLTVRETITVPDGASATRAIRLRQPAGDDLDRTFVVSDLVVDNGGQVDRDGEAVRIRFNAGGSTLRYTVDGAVADVGGAQEVRWLVSGDWDVDVDTVIVTFAAPSPPSSVTCFAGPAGSSTACTVAQITDTQLTTAREIGLAAGERVDLAVGLPAGTVPANIRLEETFTLARAFRLTPPVGLALAALLALVLGGVALVWSARGRDAAALSAAGADPAGYEPLVRDGDRVQFASPEGVLPGQIGTVIDEHVDAVDVAATVVDLAVRNYVWLAEEPGGSDWRIVRRNDADDALRPYERAVYGALLGDADEVLVSRLRGSIAGALPVIRDLMYADVVGSGWFQRRPDADRSLASRLGIGVMATGAVVTVLLAAFSTVALLGLAVIVTGVAIWLGARSLPARTALGSRLLGQLIVLRAYLHTVEATTLPSRDRELVFSRSLPYAIVLGETEHWLATFADLDPAADGTPGLYWYGGQDGADLRQFARRFPAFVSALDSALAQAGHLRSLSPAAG